MGRAVLSKSLIQFSVDGWGCVPSLFFDLRPNYGGGNEDNGELLQKVLCIHRHTQCPRPCRPPSTHSSIRDSWTHIGKSGSVSCGLLLLYPGSWCTKGLSVTSKSLFSQSCLSSIIKSHWPPKSNSLGDLSPSARPPGWEICCGS